MIWSIIFTEDNSEYMFFDASDGHAIPQRRTYKAATTTNSPAEDYFNRQVLYLKFWTRAML